MTAPMIFQALAVFLVTALLLVGVFRSRTAGALVVAYFVVQGLWMAAGLALPMLALFWIDVACIAAICTRAPVRDRYRDGTNLFACLLWLERTWCDRLVLALFVPTWAVYAFAADPWWPCWTISLAQLLAASGEALHRYIIRRGPSAAPNEDERPPGGVMFAIAGGYRGAG